MTFACPLNPIELISKVYPAFQYPRSTFCATIYQRLQALWVFFVHHVHKCSVDPSSRLDAIETADYQLELLVVGIVFVLYFAIEWCDLDTFDSLLNKSSGDFCLRLADIGFAKEKLTVEVGNINSICGASAQIVDGQMRPRVPISMT